MEHDDLLGVTATAERLGISTVRVRYFIAQQRLPAQMIGRTYTLRRADVEAFASRPRRVGRPRKPREDDDA